MPAGAVGVAADVGLRFSACGFDGGTAARGRAGVAAVGGTTVRGPGLTGVAAAATLPGGGGTIVRTIGLIVVAPAALVGTTVPATGRAGVAAAGAVLGGGPGRIVRAGRDEAGADLTGVADAVGAIGAVPGNTVRTAGTRVVVPPAGGRGTTKSGAALTGAGTARGLIGAMPGSALRTPKGTEAAAAGTIPGSGTAGGSGAGAVGWTIKVAVAEAAAPSGPLIMMSSVWLPAAVESGGKSKERNCFGSIGSIWRVATEASSSRSSACTGGVMALDGLMSCKTTGGV